ncbi:hypothetical protein DERF_001064 [Dermatophagoides farinae]|uniref:Uncharacterized protein n=1 Tax=Dermatophagoides farinae TaxID=6954 RepID=A0A922IB54_DERFA|nr:hypothetical protein DERF_001064 [Dermatophagoides farinae]
MFGPNSMCKYLICPSPSPMPPMPSLFNFHQFTLANNIFDWLLTYHNQDVKTKKRFA